MTTKLQPIEKNNQRVMTTAVLAEEYETTVKRISENFNENKDRFIEGKHYYCLEGEELKKFLHSGISGMQNQNKIRTLYLWTQKGALLHAKSLNTDRAWEVYDILVDTYFTKIQPENQVKNQIDKLKIMDMNAKTRMANTYLRMAKAGTLSKKNKKILIAKASEILNGGELISLPKSR